MKVIKFRIISFSQSKWNSNIVFQPNNDNDVTSVVNRLWYYSNFYFNIFKTLNSENVKNKCFSMVASRWHIFLKQVGVVEKEGDYSGQPLLVVGPDANLLYVTDNTFCAQSGNLFLSLSCLPSRVTFYSWGTKSHSLILVL